MSMQNIYTFDIKPYLYMFCNIGSTFKLSTFAKNMQSLNRYMHYLYLYQYNYDNRTFL